MELIQAYLRNQEKRGAQKNERAQLLAVQVSKLATQKVGSQKNEVTPVVDLGDLIEKLKIQIDYEIRR